MVLLAIHDGVHYHVPEAARKGIAMNQKRRPLRDDVLYQIQGDIRQSTACDHRESVG